MRIYKTESKCLCLTCANTKTCNHTSTPFTLISQCILFLRLLLQLYQGNSPLEIYPHVSQFSRKFAKQWITYIEIICALEFWIQALFTYKEIRKYCSVQSISLKSIDSLSCRFKKIFRHPYPICLQRPIFQRLAMSGPLVFSFTKCWLVLFQQMAIKFILLRGWSNLKSLRCWRIFFVETQWEDQSLMKFSALL